MEMSPSKEHNAELAHRENKNVLLEIRTRIRVNSCLMDTSVLIVSLFSILLGLHGYTLPSVLGAMASTLSCVLLLISFLSSHTVLSTQEHYCLNGYEEGEEFAGGFAMRFSAYLFLAYPVVCAIGLVLVVLGLLV